jgi:hypothetical protein
MKIHSKNIIQTFFLRYENDLRHKTIALIFMVEGNTLKHPEDGDSRFLHYHDTYILN